MEQEQCLGWVGFEGSRKLDFSPISAFPHPELSELIRPSKCGLDSLFFFFSLRKGVGIPCSSMGISKGNPPALPSLQLPPGPKSGLGMVLGGISSQPEVPHPKIINISLRPNPGQIPTTLRLFGFRGNSGGNF